MNQAKLQAIREKELAEQMIFGNDYVGTREHLLKSHQLFPAINNVDAMLTLCEILSAASIELPGCGIDYYWVLQVMPSASSSEISCRYQRLVTLLQSIEKKFPCIELALKLLKDALIVLGDQKKRSEFDLKRGMSWETYATFDVQASSRLSISNMEMMAVSGSSLVHKNNSSSLIEETSQFAAGLKSGQSTQADNDMCVNSMNLSMTLQPISLEGNLCSTSKAVLQKRPLQAFYNFENDRRPERFEAGQIWAVNYKVNLQHNYRYARIDSMSKTATFVTWLQPIPVTSSERRWCDVGLPIACGSFDLSLEMQMIIEVRWATISSYKCSWTRGLTEGQFEIYPRKGEIWAVYKDWNLDAWSFNPDSVKGCKFEFVEIISDFSKYLGAHGTCLVKVNGFTSIFERQKIGGNPVTFHIPPAYLYMFSHNVPAFMFKGGELDKVVDGMFELDRLALPDYMNQDNDTIKSENEGTNVFSNLTLTKQLPSFKPPSENKVLMPRWTSNDFAIGQVWAVYQGEDFMPRQYVRINNVISANQVFVTFLEPLPVLDHEIEWMREGLPIASGIYKISERRVNIEMSLFSCPVKCQDSASNSCYKIYLLKGEIWAMYKDWNAKWKMTDYESCQCLIVQILSDFSGDGIRVARLGAVKGYLTFFHTQQHSGLI
ncbi:unnamed protein product [Dovyalis caffra]|uniref:DUF3444 domain-containing protein n=1 Tax=Dovyalis caffra TaxID=77055 RepID=A0AAV1RK47_9ROSI|nr:unnamed protein product [Dovyalis caffra]